MTLSLSLSVALSSFVSVSLALFLFLSRSLSLSLSLSVCSEDYTRAIGIFESVEGVTRRKDGRTDAGNGPFEPRTTIETISSENDEAKVDEEMKLKE